MYRDRSCLDDHKVLGPGPSNRFERDGTIEGHQTAAMRGGQAEQVNVSELPVSSRQTEQPGIADGDVVRPEHMTAAGRERSQSPRDPLRTFGDRLICGILQDANYAVLGERTRRPAGGAMFREPLVGGVVMDVVRIEERDDDVHVEQGGAVHV